MPLEQLLKKPPLIEIQRATKNSTLSVRGRLLSTAFFTALALATLVPERYSKTADLTKQTSQAQSGSLLNADFATLLSGGNLSPERSTSQVTSGAAANVDQGFAEFSSDENLARMEAVAAPTPAPVLMLRYGSNYGVPS